LFQTKSHLLGLYEFHWTTFWKLNSNSGTEMEFKNNKRFATLTGSDFILYFFHLETSALRCHFWYQHNLCTKFNE